MAADIWDSDQYFDTACDEQSSTETVSSAYDYHTSDKSFCNILEFASRAKAPIVSSASSGEFSQ